MEHISHLKTLHDQLKEMGVNIEDKELAMTLLASLPEEFKALIIALDAVGEDNLSYEKVKRMLLNDADRSLSFLLKSLKILFQLEDQWEIIRVEDKGMAHMALQVTRRSLISLFLEHVITARKRDT